MYRRPRPRAEVNVKYGYLMEKASYPMMSGDEEMTAVSVD